MADDDLRLGISAVDRGAARLVRGVADALRALSSVQAQQAATTQKTAAASRAAADSFALQSRLAKDAVSAEQSRLRATEATARARIQAIRAERDEAVNAAKVMARAQEDIAKGFIRQAQERVRQARSLASIQTVTGDVSTLAAPGALAARRRELAIANENLARARALGRQQIAQAREVGTAEEAEARRTVAAQLRVLRAKQLRARESSNAARQAEQTARVEERAAARAEAAFRRQAQQMGLLNRTGAQLRNTILRLVAAYGGFRALEGFIGAGLRFNQIIESSRLGIGALITAEARLFDQQGHLITGTSALAAAQSLAEDQLTKLRIAGIQTAATTEDLVTSFEEAVGAGLAVGLTLDQIRQFSVSVAQAASAIHLPMNQLQQETRSILQGTIDRNSRIAKALQLTNEEVRLAKEQNRLAELLEEKFRAFNIAGAESIKTFGALRSNIADAFSVFAGLATRPLFEQLRNAGVAALSQIFDFRSADIASGFRGLIEGLQAMFKEIGALFADAIGGAVRNARALSDWLIRNREEVKQTAQVLRTMVEDFGHLVSSVVEAVGAFASLGGAINPVIGLARILSSIFQTVAENVKLIIALLTARTLITSIGSIVTAVAAIRAAAAGARVGSIAGPIGGAIGGTIGLILGLGTAYKLIKGDQRAVNLETARTTTALQDQTQRAAELFGTLESLSRQLKAQGLTTDETRQLNEQLAAAMEQVSSLGGDYTDIIKDQTLSLEEKRKKILELLEVQRSQAELEFNNALLEAERLRREAGIAKGRVPTQGFGAMSAFSQAQRDAADEAVAALDAQEARVTTLRTAFLRLQATITEALRTPARIQFSGKSTTDAATKDINDALQRAKAELEQVRNFNQTQRILIDLDVKNGVKTAIQQVNEEFQLRMNELDAERKVAQAEIDVASQRRIKGKVVPDQGAIDAALITLRGIDAQSEAAFQESQSRIDEILRNHVQARAKIEEDFLRATGQRIQAAVSEIRRKHDEELREAIREFGERSPEVIKIRLVIQQETITEQVKAIEDEINRITQLRDAQVANARAQLETPGEKGRGGRLTSQEQQRLADQISAANARAVASTAQLRDMLVNLRELSTDELTQTFIDKLLLQLDTMKQKAREVDLELKRLKDGIQEAFVGGLADFLDSLTDKTKKVGDSFRDMVRSILQDISRLVSRLLAEKIVFGLLGVPAASGGQVGNITQSQGRAEGGLARPSHGQLRGGIPGTDSIHIAAMPEEYFTKVQAVRHYGVELFDALNNMEMPRMNPRTFKTMAFGGAGAEGAGVTARPSQRQEVHHFLDFNEQGLITVMNGRFGRDITLKHVGRNPRAVGAAVLKGRRA